MDTAIYQKGQQIVDEDRVSILDETAKAIYLEVEGSTDTYGIRLQRDHTFSCTCPFATLKGLPKGALCSHVLACLIYVSGLDPEER